MDPRQELVDYLTRQLVGPAGGDDEVLDAPPDRQYLMGTLYPQQADLQRQLALAADDPEAAGAEEDAPDANPAADPVPETNSWLPASLGAQLLHRCLAGRGELHGRPLRDAAERLRARAALAARPPPARDAHDQSRPEGRAGPRRPREDSGDPPLLRRRLVDHRGAD
ncbi:hypothetical protein ABZ467_18160 [Streptomyces sp. NPDC005727]|uniref:hypothetical protein n=1 Tax=Streptomyces sp. NPDC005727 TaxID=3157053 RepID=UPI0033F0AD24